MSTPRPTPAQIIQPAPDSSRLCSGAGAAAAGGGVSCAGGAAFSAGGVELAGGLVAPGAVSGAVEDVAGAVVAVDDDAPDAVSVGATGFFGATSDFVSGAGAALGGATT